MTAYGILTRHELRGMMRTWRAPVLLGVVVILALIGPVTTRLMPDILSLVGGFELVTGEPLAEDAAAQWAADLAQVIPILAILVAAVSVAQPLSTGSAALLLARPVPRSSLLFAGLTANALIIAASVLVGALANSVMTALLFGEGGLEPVAMAFRWLALMAVLLASVAFGAARWGSAMGAVGTGLGVYVTLALLSAVPPLRMYSPAGLFSLDEVHPIAVLSGLALAAGGCAAAARAISVLPLASSPTS